jgi:hypothetical protein
MLLPTSALLTVRMPSKKRAGKHILTAREYCAMHGEIIWKRKYDVTDVGFFLNTCCGRTDNNRLKLILVCILFYPITCDRELQHYRC